MEPVAVSKAPRLRRKSSAFQLSLSRATGSRIEEDDLEFLPDVAMEQNSIYSNRSGGIGSQLSVPNQPAAGSSLGQALVNLRQQVEKRIKGIEYVKRSHLGGAYWFNTVQLTQEDLDKLFDPQRMRLRTTRFAVLGMSFSALLDIPAPHDFLRGLLSLVQEFEGVPDDKFERKNQKGLFRVASKARKSNASGVDFSMGLADSGDVSYLITPNIPFELDYFQVFLTLCDMLIEVYRKILNHLGSPSVSPSSFPPPPSSSSGSAYTRIGGDKAHTATLSPALMDVVLKIDSRLKKIISSASKEIDGYARAAVKRELATLTADGDFGEDV